ncbi:MAG: heparan-alpha-glucosaminide N-acetyltransferase domain-containing protein [Rhodospirillaceae bacterium]
MGAINSVEAGSNRINSLDTLRGIVMMLMALDHVRDFWCPTGFSASNLALTWPELFMTRWITHFCAPVFIFLAGVGVWFYQSNRKASAGEVSRFLLSRGIWLIFLELTIINFFWQFGYDHIKFGVIWAIGCSMIILALLVYLPRAVLIAVVVVSIFGHNLLDGLNPADFGEFGWLWRVLHVPGFFSFSDGPGVSTIKVIYPLIPWFGVIGLGYLMGPLFQRPRAEREPLLIFLGAGAVILFIVLRAFNLYGDPVPWSTQPRGDIFTVLSFINVTKYPVSLLYLLLALGPVLMLLPLLERWTGAARNVVVTFGKVPFFYYILHLPLIHVTALIWKLAVFGVDFSGAAGPNQFPPTYHPSLILCYSVWLLTIMVLYRPCLRFARYKAANKAWWLSYF